MKQALYVYIPVVHKGVIDMLDAYPGIPIWLLDNERGMHENVYLERDIRALPAKCIKVELEAHGYENIEVLDHQELALRAEAYDGLIVPNDEIVSFFLEKYAPRVKITTIPVFLRWTKQISTTEHEVPPDRTITHDAFHNGVLKDLFQEAKKSPDWWRQIAAAIVQEDMVCVTAYNKHFPTPYALVIQGDPRSNLDAGQGPGVYTSIHAEAAAIAAAARAGIKTEGATLYVTTFPCAACARLLIEAGITTVYYRNGYSLLDAEEVLKASGIEIVLVEEKI
jgi:dCMP deaminase